MDQAGRHYTTAGGEHRAYPTYLLRRSYRDGQGRPRKETLANLTGLPPEAIEALRAALRGRTLVDAEAAFEVARSVPHGDVAAAHVLASRLGLAGLLGPACRERDIAYALILSRAVRPKPKLATARWWAGGDTTLGDDLGVADAITDEVYAAMDWLTGRQREIEKKLAARHLTPGGIAMFDLSISWVEGTAASSPPSGIPATASAAAARSSTGCSPTSRAARSRSRCSPETPRPEVVQERDHRGPRQIRNRKADHGRGPRNAHRHADRRPAQLDGM